MEHTQMERTQSNGLAQDSRADRIKGIANSNGLQLGTMQDMIDFASIVAQSGLAPRGLETPQKLFVALAMGAEVGLSPMQSIQNIGVINGRPSLYGSIALGLVRASGLLESIEEYIVDGDGNYVDIVKHDSPDDVMAVCVTRRKGGMEVRSTFSIAEAKAAQLWNKQGPWQQYKKNMMKYRARGINLSDNFSDVLRGIPTLEEQIGNDVIPTEQQQESARQTNSLTEKLHAAKQKQQAPVEPKAAKVANNGGKDASAAKDKSTPAAEKKPHKTPPNPSTNQNRAVFGIASKLWSNGDSKRGIDAVLAEMKLPRLSELDKNQSSKLIERLKAIEVGLLPVPELADKSAEEPANVPQEPSKTKDKKSMPYKRAVPAAGEPYGVPNDPPLDEGALPLDEDPFGDE